MAVNNLSYEPGHFGFITLRFPTPTLSLGERENCAPLLVQINVIHVLEALGQREAPNKCG